MCTKSLQMCTQMCTNRTVGPSTQLWDFNTFLKTYLIQIYEPFVWFTIIAGMRGTAVFGVIFLIFIEFEWPVLRSLVFARCVTWNHPLGRENHFEHHFSEHGRSPSKTVSSRGAGETPKRGPKKHLMGSNWLKGKVTLGTHKFHDFEGKTPNLGWMLLASWWLDELERSYYVVRGSRWVSQRAC